MAENKNLEVTDKQEVQTTAEQTRPGPVYLPRVDIFESDRKITLLADMPGATSEDTCIDLKDGVLTIAGEINPWEGPDESDVLIEFEAGRYYRRFNLTDTIDQDSISAKFKDGVLRLALPKVQKAVPRQIAVTAG